MVENFLLGAGVKLVGNLVTSWFDNNAEERRNNSLRNEKVIKAQVELTKETNRNAIMVIVRGIVYICITLTWCYMGIYGLSQENLETSVLIPNDPGWFGKLFHHQDLRKVDIKGTTLLYQWWQIMEMIMGAFVMPSRKT